MDGREYEIMYAAESRHWWFRGSRRVIQDLLQRFRPLRERGRPLRLIDLGCGTGYTLRRLRALAGIEVIGVDVEAAALGFCQQRGLGSLVAGRLEVLPFADRCADVLLALDVIEHLEDDAAALGEMHRVLAPGGILILSVPAHRWLWSKHDEALHHKRRYQRDELATLLRAAGFRVRLLSHYNSFLLPAIAAVRLVGRILRPAGLSPQSDVSVPGPLLNELLAVLFAAERHLLARMELPLGVSLVAVAEV